jgi:hypothetical protein
VQLHRKLKRLTDQSVGFHYTGFSAEKPLDKRGVICEIFKTIKPTLCKTENFCPILHWAGKGTQPAAKPFFYARPARSGSRRGKGGPGDAFSGAFLLCVFRRFYGAYSVFRNSQNKKPHR